MDYSLTYFGNCPPSPLCFQDASFGDGPDRRSRTGYVIIMCGAAIAWCSRLQSTVALSTVEAEYMSLAAACQEILHVRQLLKSLGIDFTSDVGGRVGLVRHGWHVCGGCLSCEVSVFWL